MDGKIFSSGGHYVAYVRADAIYDIRGNKLYELKGSNIYKTTGELVGHLPGTGPDTRLDKATDRLFPRG
jgi:hypothetical protein